VEPRDHGLEYEADVRPSPRLRQGEWCSHPKTQAAEQADRHRQSRMKPDF
jgi:hypothetical protein